MVSTVVGLNVHVQEDISMTESTNAQETCAATSKACQAPQLDDEILDSPCSTLLMNAKLKQLVSQHQVYGNNSNANKY